MVRPSALPSSTSSWRDQLRSDCGEHPSSAASCGTDRPLRPQQLDRLAAELQRIRRGLRHGQTSSAAGPDGPAIKCPRNRGNSIVSGAWFIRAPLEAERCRSHQSQGGHRMKLHANAALSLNKRRRAVSSGSSSSEWTLTKAAAAAEVSVRCARKWVARYRAEGELGLLDRSSAPRSVANRTDEQRDPGDRRVAAAAVHRPGDRRGARDGRSRRSRGSSRGSGWASSGGWVSSPPQRYERARPGELIHIDVKKLGRIDGGAGNRVTAASAATTAPTTDHGRHRRGQSAGSSCTSPSTTPPAWPTPRSSPTRRPPPRSRSCAAPIAFFDRHGITVERAAHRQRLGLPLHRPRDRLPRPGHPPPAHPPLPPPDQRQGRTLHPHHARRLGLRRDLPQQHRTHRRP